MSSPNLRVLCHPRVKPEDDILGNSKFPNIKNPPTPKNLATSRCEAKKVAPRKCGCETKIGILVLGILEFLGNFAQEFYIEFKIPESRIPRIKL